MAKKQYLITIELLSDTLVGSAEGYSAIIDTDVVFDDIGIPFIPAKRIKGILRENASEMIKLFEQKVEPEKVFGKSGETVNETPLKVSNLFVKDYEDNKKHLQYYINNETKRVLSKDDVMAYFTTIRSQTAMEKGERVARRGSLRKSRVLRSGLTFHGTMVFDESYENLIGLACLNTRRIGTMRNRGFGEVRVTLSNKIVETALQTTLKTFEEMEANK